MLKTKVDWRAVATLALLLCTPVRVDAADAGARQPARPSGTEQSRTDTDYPALRAALLGRVLETAPGVRSDIESFGQGRDPSAQACELPWSPLPGPDLMGAGVAYDSRRHRLIALGGYSSQDFDQRRIWQLSLTRPPKWSEIVAMGPSPIPRRGLSAVYDSLRDRVLVYGGFGRISDDLWALSLSGTPTWSQITVDGVRPPIRGGHSAFYDPVHDAMAVFGGAAYPQFYNDTWILSLSPSPAWRQLEPSGELPAGRWGQAAAFAPVRQQMIVTGGDDYSHSFADTWVLSLEGQPKWEQVLEAGVQPGWPSGLSRTGHSLVYDPIGDRVILFAGSSNRPHNDLWGLSLSGPSHWSELTPAAPPPSARLRHSAVYDPEGHRMIVVGGETGDAKWVGGTDSWALSLDGPLTWSALTGGTGQPFPRMDQTAVYDSRRDRMVIYGGYLAESFKELLGDVSALPLRESVGWTKLWALSGPNLPRARAAHSAVYDPVRDRMIIFGGAEDDLEEGDFLGNDLWTFSFSALPDAPWSQLEPVGAKPSPRAWHRAVYDPDGDRMIVYGGVPGTITEDIWSLSLTGTPIWTELHAYGGPGPLAAHSLVYDSKRRRILAFGGFDGTRTHGDTWALTLGKHLEWSLVADESNPHLARLYHSAVYDETNDRMVIWGGFQSLAGTVVNDCWALDLKGRAEWHQIAPENAPPYPRDGHSAIYDPRGERMVIFGGNGTLNDTWTLPMPGARGRAEVQVASQDTKTSPAALDITAVRPNPFSAGSEVEFALPHSARASLSVFDAAGRRVRLVAEAQFPAGSHTLAWDGLDAAGQRVASGVYLVRLESNGSSVTRKVLLARGTPVH